MIGVWCDGDFIAKVDVARKRGEFPMTRSQFARNALREKLIQMDFVVPQEQVMPPEGTKKRGRKPKIKTPEGAAPVVEEAISFRSVPAETVRASQVSGAAYLMNDSSKSLPQVDAPSDDKVTLGQQPAHRLKSRLKK